ncbi:MAG: tRNA lysidine(34) synthetase TilS [Phycisphaerae bacterium]|jgi:tRNA(Ile)-lysidine synthase
MTVDEKVQEFLASIGAGDIIAGLSGGADSVCLLHCLVQSAGKRRIYALHINHNLRGAESDGDEAFCRDLCAKLGVEFYCESVDAEREAKRRGLSLETAARELRLGLFGEYCDRLGAKFIATGHHAGDNCETIIHRMMRGTHFRGLCGILPERQIRGLRIISPLLDCSKEDILAYCEDNGLPFRTDSSNLTTDYTRNRLRNQLIPELKKGFPELEEKLCELSKAARRYRNAVEREASSVWHEAVEMAEPDKVVIKQERFLEQNLFVRQEILRRALVGLGAGENKLTSAHYEAMMKAAGSRDSRKYQLPDNIYMFAGYDRVIFAGIGGEGVESTLIRGDGAYKFRNWRIDVWREEFDRKKFALFLKNPDKHITIFDADKISLPITARERRNGDRFRPFGADCSQKVSKFFMRARVNRLDRSIAVVMTDRNDKIIWVAPHRAAEVGRVTVGTKNVLIIKMELYEAGK